MNFVSVNGVTLHHRFHDAGAGKPVLAFVNSLGTDFRIWDLVIERLEGRYSMLLHDKRGHGLSETGATPYDMATLADDVAGLLGRVGVESATIVGLSVGGMIAQQLAATRPDLVKGLVLCDTAHRIGTVASWNDRIAAVERSGIAPLVDGVMRNWFTPAFRSANNPLFAGCRAMLERQHPAGYMAVCAALRDCDLTRSSARLSVPTLCVVGDQDGSTPPDLVRSTAQLIPGARFEIIADAGHIPCIEQPDRLAALIADFAEGLPS